MNYKRVLTIQDISCLGQCSLTVALPILSACGHETVILPSAVLSTHTGGFQGVTFRDLTEDIPSIRQHWMQEGITFDAIYTGYLGSVKQIGYVADILDTFGGERVLKIIDPAMADHGKLYAHFDEAYAQAMAGLCRKADLILPNITEASLMTGIPYRESYDESYIQELLQALLAMGVKGVILTGVSYDADTTGIVVCDGKRTSYYRHEKLAKNCHGTGDIFASTFTGALLHGKKPQEAVRIAGDYVLRCMKNTAGDDSHWYGVKFETALPYLMQRMEERGEN